MTERRTQIQIIYDILKAVHDKGGTIKPTHLLYKSNLSHKRMKEYVDQLSEKNMITTTTVKKKNFYQLTDEGRKFLADYRQFAQFTEAFGL